MGARHAEFALGLWLAMSPFVFGHAEGFLLWHDLLCGTLAMLLPLLCYHRRLHRAHIGLLPLGTWLLAFGWWTTRSDLHSGPAQNHVLVGLLLLMLAIIPSRAAELPTGWRRFLAGSTRGSSD